MRASEADLILLCACKGMAISCAGEKLRGKQPKLSDLQHMEPRGMHDIGGYSISDLAELSVSCPTVYRTLGRQRPAT